MSVTIKVGQAEVVAISDKAHEGDPAWTYPDVPAAAWLPYADMLTADGMIALNFGCYLVRCDGRSIVVDTGWGPEARPPGHDAGPGRLLDELAAVGASPGDIDTVVFTHLHADHVGWNLIRDDDSVRPRFANARYLVPEADWRHYNSLTEMHPNIRDQALPLGDLGVLDLVAGDQAIAPSLRTVATPGHTPGHQ
ncbi:MAG: MBL fold metallo-hydrolase, partial [Candidatus Limnocylindrales bacterium]